MTTQVIYGYLLTIFLVLSIFESVAVYQYFQSTNKNGYGDRYYGFVAWMTGIFASYIIISLGFLSSLIK